MDFAEFHFDLLMAPAAVASADSIKPRGLGFVLFFGTQ